MFQIDQENKMFGLAVDLVRETSRHLFLTGKAGTGKTTFLRFIKESSGKNSVVVAPTGVAAINAAGVTMHSFFQLPRGVFIPGSISGQNISTFTEITDRRSIFKNIHFNKNKIELLKELELLIIDEVSMMRADMLDAIDTILRHFRRTPHMPFGGVQVLYIGDLYQLPPVVPNDEWNLLCKYYQSPFFFDAQVMKEAAPLSIELNKIYRQNEQNFIDVLNNIRNNNVTPLDFELLESRYSPEFRPSSDDRYITVSTHNKKADAINSSELLRLQSPLFVYNAEISRDFSDKAYPTEVELQLKEGAQVMFIKNDSAGERRYFNGKLAVISRLSGSEIEVVFEDGNKLVLERETWKNIRYSYDRQKDKIEEEELGSFTQYPIRLAWAITVHKSQGLTFEKAIIDAGASFAAGQVYVALSRCTTLHGLVLRSRIHSHVIATDPRVVSFSQNLSTNEDYLQNILAEGRTQFRNSKLLKLFTLDKLVKMTEQWVEDISSVNLPDYQQTILIASQANERLSELSLVAAKFQNQLKNILINVGVSGDTTILNERMQKAIEYIGSELAGKVLLPVQKHKEDLIYTQKLKEYKQFLSELEETLWQYLKKLSCAGYGELMFCGKEMFNEYDPARFKKPPPRDQRRGSSQAMSLELFKEGISIKEIAKRRNLAISTIESHLAGFVLTGEVNAEALISEGKLKRIMDVIRDLGNVGAVDIKSRLDNTISFHEVRVGMNHYRFSQKQTA